MTKMVNNIKMFGLVLVRYCSAPIVLQYINVSSKGMLSLKDRCLPRTLGDKAGFKSLS